MSRQTTTPHLQLPLPCDQSFSAPWGEDDHVLALALAKVDAHLGAEGPPAAAHDALEARVTALEERLSRIDANFQRVIADLGGKE